MICCPPVPREVSMSDYSKETDIRNEKKLRELLRELPPYVSTYMTGVSQLTASRTRLAYAYDLRIFFRFLKEKNPRLKNTEIREIPIEVLQQLNTKPRRPPEGSSNRQTSGKASSGSCPR